MPKFYVISDVHGFYNEMREALDKAGFDPNDENSWLISCGDVWDRGKQPLDVMNYLMSLPRVILIKGNHSQLFKDCCERGCPYMNDYSNGTVETICELGGEKYGRSFQECCIVAEQVTKRFLDKEINYFETKHYVFCHSWVPVNCGDWRTAHQREWDEAMWVNPLQMAIGGATIAKTICSGHWHSSAGWAMEKGLPEFGDGACFEPYYYKDKLIMLDACTAYSHKVNVLVLEDEFMEENKSE